ncbi:hypothetical protein BK816_06440 [Boudabousia tangfeifanii]|uniref:NlpC/P60 domain-containing protein n=1 Tax=Boudabousia tangfeifanii TaxID=1912795 RepID=A0A1D9MLD7_9ACTO|nr:C40 family peptidase [Boudabousia tangfeifanii]AOZ72970.1 hypothetical protein BK816_06440 [Boudabousia tangfeifanii]
MQKTSQVRHRAAKRPNDSRRGARTMAAATTTGLALSAIAGAGVAGASPVESGAATVDVSSLAQKAQAALAVNAPVAVAKDAKWDAEGADVEVKVFDARAERRKAAEAEAKARREAEEKAQREAEEAAQSARSSRSASRSATRSAARSAAPSNNSSANTSSQSAAKAEVKEAPRAVSSAGSSSVVGIAFRYLGTPYRWGGSTPSGFDCSGFTSYVYRQVGINLPHSSGAQRGHGTQVSAAAAKPGDLVWHPGHVGIYIGGGKMIHSPRPGKGVEVVPVRGGDRFYRMR